MQLFRPEALRGQDRLHGDVALVAPVSWQAMGLFLLGTLAAASLFLATARYARVTPVAGTLTGDRGIIRSVPARAGTVAQVLVREGQQVAAGTPLVRIAAKADASSFLVTAAASGTVTGILAHRGAAVSPDSPILSIVPAGTRLRARLHVPPAAAGFLESGQPIRIAVDAFPYQTYGTVPAQVDFISAATIPVALPDGSGTIEAFLVQATLDRDAIEAFGRQRPLRPGMTIRARITTRSRSLAEWLFEPLYAVARR